MPRLCAGLFFLCVTEVDWRKEIEDPGFQTKFVSQIGGGRYYICETILEKNQAENLGILEFLSIFVSWQCCHNLNGWLKDYPKAFKNKI